MNPDGSDQTRFTFNAGSDRRPDTSPNGREIVFSSNRITETNPEGDFEIFVMNSDGSDVRQLTLNASDDSWPRWSPNGKWIAFHSNVDGNYEIYVVRPDGTDLTRITDYPGLDQFPEWSPNGKQLAIRRDLELYLIDKDGSNPVRLTFTTPPAFNQMASWSPNGSQLAFLSTREGYPSIFVMDADGSNQINLTPRPNSIPPASPWSSRTPGWSRNGQFIYFTGLRSETGSNEQIFVMNTDGTDVTQLTFTGVNSEAAVR
jgi:TolB protein